MGDRDEARALLAAEVAPGDLVLTLGAGDIYRLAEDLVAEKVTTEGDGS